MISLIGNQWSLELNKTLMGLGELYSVKKSY